MTLDPRISRAFAADNGFELEPHLLVLALMGSHSHGTYEYAHRHPLFTRLVEQRGLFSSQRAAGWDLTAERVAKSVGNGERRTGGQWTMNNTLAAIGIHFPKHRQRAISIGETLGIYRDYPVSKGCTPPFAPIWINAMVSRQRA